MAGPRSDRDHGPGGDPRGREHLGHRRRRGRERRRRTAAIDARESAAEAAEAAAAVDADPGGRAVASRRDEPLLEPREPVVAEPEEDPQRTQALDPVEPTQE